MPLAVALGDQYSPTISPDGRRVAFAWNGEHHNNFDIYVKDISSPSPPLRLTTNEDIDYSPAWSPDGRWIAFCRGASGHEGAIWLIHPLGGPERKLVVVSSTAAPTRRDLAWSRDSKSLVVTGSMHANGPSQISQIDIETGEAKPLVSARVQGQQYLISRPLPRRSHGGFC